jgi:hypothetical protein
MIADPMADLSGGGVPSGSKPGDPVNMSSTKGVFDPMVLGSNLQRIDRIRSVMGIAAGVVAGIGGLTGWKGLRK